VPENREGEPPTLRVVVASGSSSPGKFDWAALGTVGALVASITYLLLNSAYVEFYESIGARPEDVGLDRLAILGRALGLALFALFIYGLSFGLEVLILFLLRKFGPPDARSQIPSPSGRHRRNRIMLGVAGLLACLFALLAVLVAVNKASDRAELAEKGIHVSPVSLHGPLFIDVNADYARIDWLDKNVPPPALLRDPWLLYLGGNGRVAVFMACGTTVIVPANKVVPEVLTTGEARRRENATPSESDMRDEFCAIPKL
jgi:hypothetical protein